MIVHAGVAAAPGLALERVGGDRDDRHATLVAGQRTDRPRRADAVQLRHLHVHQDEVEGLAAGRLDRLAAVVGETHAVAGIGQDVLDDGLIDEQILRDQDACRDRLGSAFAQCRRGC
jgi:hypothetical protein